MRKIVFLLISLLMCTPLHSQIYYNTGIGGKIFNCQADAEGVYCGLQQNDFPDQPIWLEQPYSFPGEILPNQEKEGIRNFLSNQGYHVQQFNEMSCKRQDAKVFSFVSRDESGRILQGMARVDSNTVTLLLQGLPNMEALGNNFIFTYKIADEICYLDLPPDTIFLFGKPFICNQKEGKKTVAKFVCKLDESDPQAKFMAIDPLWLPSAPVFEKPKKFLEELMTGLFSDPENTCKTKKIFSCPQKDVFIGVCNDGKQEILLRQSARSVLVLYNTDLLHPIADKQHRQELCGVTWGRRLL